MVTIAPWAAFALSAAVFWGLAYAMSGRVIHAGLTTPFILLCVALIAIPFYIFDLLQSGKFRYNLDILFGNKLLALFILIQAASLLTGQYLIYHAISQKSATYAAILEISYPIFTCLFTWLLFQELQLSWNLALGGAMIFCGAALVFLKSGS